MAGRTFFLGWQCTGAIGDPTAPHPWPGPTAQGCFDATLHQTAPYDFLAAGLVFAVLLLLERRPRFDGFVIAAFVLLYGGGRFVSDFARAADRGLVGTLTGSQVTVVLAITSVLAWVAVTRPDRRLPWAWSPPDFSHGWGAAGAVEDPPGSTPVA